MSLSFEVWTISQLDEQHSERRSPSCPEKYNSSWISSTRDVWYKTSLLSLLRRGLIQTIEWLGVIHFQNKTSAVGKSFPETLEKK